MERSNLIKNIWHKVSYIGIPDNYSGPDKRSIVIVNRINFIILAIMVILNIGSDFHTLKKGWELGYGSFRLLFVLFISVAIFFINAKKHFGISKLILSIAPAFFLIIFPTFMGIAYIGNFLYYQIALLGLSIVPHLFYALTPKKYTYIIIIIFYFLAILFIDDLTVFFSKKEFEIVETINRVRFYYKLVPVTVFLFVHFILFCLKRTNLEYESERNSYIKKLNQSNSDLSYSNRIIKEQKEEIETTLNRLHETQQHLIQAEKMASIGILTAGIAHEINNPVNYISGGLTGLKKLLKTPRGLLEILIRKQINLELTDEENEQFSYSQIQQSAEKIERMVEHIEKGIVRTNNIIENMRAFSSSSDDKFQLTNINNDIDTVIALLYNSYKDRISVKKHYCENSSVEVMSGKIQQVFMNLINNAIQAIKNTGTITISTFWSKNNEIFNIAIEDTGSGIPKNVRSKIFDPFFTTKDVGEGTGLGLYLSYQFIEQHKGSIKFTSRVNKGTEFVVQLPKHKVANK